MRTLDITWLRSVVAVASFGGVRRAADALHVSQPTVSGHPRALESELGFAVVSRRGRSIAFTSRGEDVLREAHRVVGAHDDAIARLVGPDTDDLVIASTQHATEPMVSAVARVLAEHYPRHSVRCRFHRTDRVREFVHDHSADVAIGIGDLGVGTRHVAELPLTRVSAGEHVPDPHRLVTFTPPCTVRERILASDVARTATVVRE